MKKFMCVLMSVFCMLVPTESALAYTQVTAGKYEGSAFDMDYVKLETTDYVNIDGYTYLPVTIFSYMKDEAVRKSGGQSSDWENDNIEISFDPVTKELTFENNFWISSRHWFEAKFTANKKEYTVRSVHDPSLVYSVTALNAPKIINGHFYLPTRTLDGVFDFKNISYNKNTKTLSFTMSLA